MTPQERADILARHIHSYDSVMGEMCDTCDQRWPCDAYRLGHDIDEEALAVALDSIDSQSASYWDRRATPAVLLTNVGLADRLADAYRKEVR